MDEYITIDEAIKLTGKSKSTIKKYVRQIREMPDGKGKDKLLHHEKTKNGYRNKVLKSYIVNKAKEPLKDGGKAKKVTTSHGVTNPTDPLPLKIIEILQKELDAKTQQLQQKDEQIRRQANQIDQLQITARENLKLLNQEQQLHLITQTKLKELQAPEAPAEHTEAETVRYEETPETETTKTEPKPTGNRVKRFFVGLFSK